MKKIFYTLLLVLSLSACNKQETLSSKNYVMQNTPQNINITLGFNTEENKYFGGVVNRFFGNYTSEGTKITFAPGGSTMMMGPPNAMKAEQGFFATLQKINSYKLDGETLVLITTDGQELTFIESATQKGD